MNLKKEIEKLEKNGWLENTSNIDIEKLNEIIERRTTPKCDEDIFKSLNLFPMKETQILIIGQDPYPNEEKAHGLAFSVKNKNRRAASLTKIFKARDSIYGKKSHNYNLEEWAKENKVLLLNSALTYEKAEKKQAKIQKIHSDAWRCFMVKILDTLFKENKNIAVFLWGQKANKLFNCCENKNKIAKVYETCHPQKRFEKGKQNEFIEKSKDHFKECDKFLKKDIWKNL